MALTFIPSNTRKSEQRNLLTVYSMKLVDHGSFLGFTAAYIIITILLTWKPVSAAGHTLK